VDMCGDDGEEEEDAVHYEVHFGTAEEEDAEGREDDVDQG